MKVVIIGAGPAGLTAANEILKDGKYEVEILEESDYIGGIARTIKYNGNRMDIGRHRFFSKDERIMKYWNPCFEDYFSYVVWDEKYVESLDWEMIEKIHENFKNNDNIYYIYTYDEWTDVDTAEINGYFTKIFESSFSLSGESYIIYKINN